MNKKALQAVALSFIILLIASLFISYRFSLLKPRIELAADFPQTPVYENAELVKSAKDPREDILWDATWVSESDVPTVSKWYLYKLKSEGWTVDVPPADTTAEDIQYAELSKDSFYVLHLSFIKNSAGKTEIVTDYLKWVESEKEGKFINDPPGEN